jgi:phage gpG-like protein
VRLFIEAVGLREAEMRFHNLARHGTDTIPVMVEISRIMMHAIAQNFESQGRRGGGSWRRLSEQWARYKEDHALDPRIGYATHELVESLTVERAPHQILEISPDMVRLSSDLPYVGTQQAHRPFARFTASDRRLMGEMVKDYFIEAWVAAA